ncbi:MAG: epoxyqueuosine reductase QueH [Deltaproteobacteria bacterium]|nr:epoxyqueuosine reductase QueH [Deltaproteobacteria bacterium]
MEKKPEDGGAAAAGALEANAPESLLLHVCCAPCAIYPLRELCARFPGTRILAWFYNPNIHPASEYRRRRDALAYLFALRDSFLPPGSRLSLDLSAPYRPDEFLALAAMSPRRPVRCGLCYSLRLEAAARKAAEAGAGLFTTTLLYSRRQGHSMIAEAGEGAAAREGVHFHYQDFRAGWKEGRELSVKLDVYRQNYCGCLYGQIDN